MSIPKHLLLSILLLTSTQCFSLSDLLSQTAQPAFTPENLNTALKGYVQSVFGVDSLTADLSENLNSIRLMITAIKSHPVNFQVDVAVFQQKFTELSQKHLTQIKEGDFSAFFVELTPYLKNYIGFEYAGKLRDHVEGATLTINLSQFLGIKNFFKHMKGLLVSKDEQEESKITTSVQRNTKNFDYSVFITKLKDLGEMKDDPFGELTDLAKQLINMNNESSFNDNKGVVSGQRVLSIAVVIKAIGEKLSADQPPIQNEDSEEEFESDEAWLHSIENLITLLMTERMKKVENDSLTTNYNKWSLGLIKELLKLMPIRLAADYAIIYLQNDQGLPEVKADYIQLLIELYNKNEIPFTTSGNDSDKLLVSDYLSLFSNKVTPEQKQQIVNNFDILADIDPKKTQTIGFTSKLIETTGLVQGIEGVALKDILPMSFEQRLEDDGSLRVTPSGMTIDNLLNQKMKENPDFKKVYLLYKLLNLQYNLIDEDINTTVFIDFDEDMKPLVVALTSYQDELSNQIRELIYRLYTYDENKTIPMDADINSLLDQVAKQNYDVGKLIQNKNQPLSFESCQVDIDKQESWDSVNPLNQKNKPTKSQKKFDQLEDIDEEYPQPITTQKVNNNQFDLERDQEMIGIEKDEDNIVHEVIGNLKVGDKIVLEKSKDLVADIKRIENVVNNEGTLIEYVYVLLDDIDSPCYNNN